MLRTYNIKKSINFPHVMNHEMRVNDTLVPFCLDDQSNNKIMLFGVFC